MRIIYQSSIFWQDILNLFSSRQNYFKIRRKMALDIIGWFTAIFHQLFCDLLRSITSSENFLMNATQQQRRAAAGLKFIRESDKQLWSIKKLHYNFRTSSLTAAYFLSHIIVWYDITIDWLSVFRDVLSLLGHLIYCGSQAASSSHYNQSIHS